VDIAYARDIPPIKDYRFQMADGLDFDDPKSTWMYKFEPWTR